MGNLKGGNFDKQVRNALIRLNARGQKRYGTDSRKTHSNALMKKREMYLRDFARFAESKGLEGKLNTLVTESNITEFLNERLQDLSPKTALDYVTGFNSMLKGLEQTKVNISREAYGVLREYTSDYRAEFNAVKDNYETGRAIQDTQAFISNLQEIRESSATIAQLQLETGLRASEALEVAKNFSNYYNEQNSTLEGVIGKGGQEYPVKQIDLQLAYKLQNLQETPSYSTYYRDIQSLEHKTHDLRITYTKELYESLKEQGYSHREALKEVSTQINHHREAITLYYLARG
jgi:integrase